VVGEKADWRSSTNHYVAGEIVAVHKEKDSYEVLLDDGRHVSNVSASDLRRYSSPYHEYDDTDEEDDDDDEEEDDAEDDEDEDEPPRSMLKGEIILRVGARVRAEFPGANGVFPGVIDRIHGNDMYAIRYDDGDYAHEVHKSMIYL
jgi:hypothetical protein